MTTTVTVAVQGDEAVAIESPRGRMVVPPGRWVGELRIVGDQALRISVAAEFAEDKVRTTPGIRLHPEPGEEDFLLRVSQTPGAYGTVNGRDWFATTPNGMLGNLGNHQVREHEDGTITVAPSIQVYGGPDEGWHGYLERGVWREC